MTALFLVIFVEQWFEKKNRIPEVIGVAVALVCLWIFGADNFILPTMIIVIAVLFIGKKRLDEKTLSVDDNKESEVSGTCR